MDEQEPMARGEMESQLKDIERQINDIDNSSSDDEDDQQPPILARTSNDVAIHTNNNENMMNPFVADRNADFSIELSENLLKECRKLQAINQEKSKALEDKTKENEKINEKLNKALKEYRNSKDRCV